MKILLVLFALAFTIVFIILAIGLFRMPLRLFINDPKDDIDVDRLARNVKREQEALNNLIDTIDKCSTQMNRSEVKIDSNWGTWDNDESPDDDKNEPNDGLIYNR